MRSITAAGRADQESPEVRFIHHESFEDRRQAAVLAAEEPAGPADHEFAQGHMPDDLTRACAQRMHYAAYRAQQARTAAEAARWRTRYFALRDRIILGNRKLIFSAVRKKLYQTQHADDLIGECYIVMIRVVAAYNPWLGIRFSTYAFTCLMRALARLNQRTLADRLSGHLSLEAILGSEPAAESVSAEAAPGSWRLDDYFREEHPLLSAREKMVLRRRFRMGQPGKDSTLEKVGRDLGLSKERVRQVQASAIGKLRQALVEGGKST